MSDASIAAVTPSAAALDTLIAAAAAQTPIKHQGGSAVWRLPAPSEAPDPALRRDWALKRVALPWWKSAAPRWMQLTPGQRQQSGSELLIGSGLRFAGPSAVVRRDGGAVEYTLVPWVQGLTLDRWWPQASAEARLGMAESLGRLLGRLTNQRLRNRDFKPTNLLVDALAEHGALPVMIDLDGVGRGGTRREVVRSAAVLDRALRRVDTVGDEELRALVEAFCDESPQTLGDNPGGAETFQRKVAEAGRARPLSYDPAVSRNPSESVKS